MAVFIALTVTTVTITEKLAKIWDIINYKKKCAKNMYDQLFVRRSGIEYNSI